MPSIEYSGKMHKFLRYLADLFLAVPFLCWHYIFDSYFTCSTIKINTGVYVYFHSPPKPPALLTFVALAALAFPLMFNPGIMYVFYLDMIKQHETNLSAEKSNKLFGIPQYIKL